MLAPVELKKILKKKVYPNIDAETKMQIAYLLDEIEKQYLLDGFIKQYAEEICFVLSSNNYQEYLNTYDGIDSPIILSEDQFNVIKEYFKKD